MQRMRRTARPGGPLALLTVAAGCRAASLADPGERRARLARKRVRGGCRSPRSSGPFSGQECYSSRSEAVPSLDARRCPCTRCNETDPCRREPWHRMLRIRFKSRPVRGTKGCARVRARSPSGGVRLGRAAFGATMKCALHSMFRAGTRARSHYAATTIRTEFFVNAALAALTRVSCRSYCLS